MNQPDKTNRISRRQFLRGGIHTAFLGLLAACGPRATPTANTEGAAPIPNPSRVPTLDPAHISSPPAATQSASVSLQDKIGQMVLVGMRGLTLQDDNPIVADLAIRHIGAVVLFDYDMTIYSPVRNVQSPDQLAGLTNALQEKAVRPLLISTDQEGGMVARLGPAHGFPATRSEQSLGTLNDLGKTRENAETMARTLSEMGINLNLAPVVDLNTNPRNPVIGQLERSFSADPAVVTAHALEEIRAHHRHGVLTTLKHFPGHGSSRTDSHSGFVDVTDTWSEVELEPFRQIIAAGECDAIMTAHIFNAKLDDTFPATLSRRIITGILRERLQYDGVVISDDMRMGAISQYYGLEAAVANAIQAGVDILAIANNSPLQFDAQIAERLIGMVLRLVHDGKITEARIDESYGRITRLKARLV